jgi:hypothetical protein
MSLVESVLSNSVGVKSQYDKDNSIVSTNQCSWCAFEFASKADELKMLWIKGDHDNFINLYNDCVKNGSIQRKVNFTFTCGENIDDEIIKTNYKSLSEKYTYVTELNSEMKKPLLDILPEELAKTFFVRPDIKRCAFSDFIKITLNNIVKNVLIINRFGQSFTIIPLFSRGKYIILDSHTHLCGETDIYGIEKYITMNNQDGYNLILWSVYTQMPIM